MAETHTLAPPLADDAVLPFQVDGADVRGRILRLGPAIDAVLSRHAYPETVSAVLGEALILAALIGSGMKLRHRFSLQVRGDGPVSMLVADYAADGSMRGYAGFDEAAVAAAGEGAGATGLFGGGALALTIDQGPDMTPYQGIVPLEGTSLSDAAMGYFEQSDQLRSAVRISVARAYQPGGTLVWRGGGIMIQRLGQSGEAAKVDCGEDAEESWTRARLLMESAEDHELTDPALGPGALLYRLFHEDGVRVFDEAGVRFGCSCEASRVEAVLRQYGPEDLSAMVEDGAITARCQFCSARYAFDPADFGIGQA